MVFFGQETKQDTNSNKTIETVRIIKIFFDSDTDSLDSQGFAKGTAFVCLILYTDGTKKLDVVNLRDMNGLYVNYIQTEEKYYP